jgi:hypothetical protein
MDKVMTMILFSTVKKGAAEVESSDPLVLKLSDPLPDELHIYEEQFLKSMELKDKKLQKESLQNTMINLVNSLAKKMKGFSRKETVEYYQTIVKKAWAQVESAETPEVKSAKFEEVMDWTMLDKDYEDKTKNVFRTGPVFVPYWWPRMYPTYPRPAGHASPAPLPSGLPAAPSSGKPSLSLPHLPGGEFAATLAGSVQNFSGNVIGNVSDFTRQVTSKTNPAALRTSSFSGKTRTSGSAGSSCVCACACACAGCACACAGGGR